MLEGPDGLEPEALRELGEANHLIHVAHADVDGYESELHVSPLQVVAARSGPGQAIILMQAAGSAKQGGNAAVASDRCACRHNYLIYMDLTTPQQS